MARIAEIASNIAKTASGLAESGFDVPVNRAPLGESQFDESRDADFMPHMTAGLLYNMRRRRDEIFGNDSSLFADPAWDILLDLFSCHEKGIKVSVGRACAAARVPYTTALRYLVSLEDAALILRQRDKQDSRRMFVLLTPAAVEKLSKIMTIPR